MQQKINISFLFFLLMNQKNIKSIDVKMKSFILFTSVIHDSIRKTNRRKYIRYYRRYLSFISFLNIFKKEVNIKQIVIIIKARESKSLKIKGLQFGVICCKVFNQRFSISTTQFLKITKYFVEILFLFTRLPETETSI